jgi:hypothetical protein
MIFYKHVMMYLIKVIESSCVLGIVTLPIETDCYEMVPYCIHIITSTF